MGTTPIRRKVRPAELCQRFNEGNYWGRALGGEFQQVVLRDNHPALVGSTEPFCTRSQIVAYLNATGEKIAVVHQYVRQDGIIGASGQPDPKMLFENGVRYYVVRPDEMLSDQQE